MVRHIDDDGVLMLKPTDNLVNNRVVIKHGIVIVGIDLQPFRCQFLVRIVSGSEFPSGLHRETSPIVHMLSHQMENGQLVCIVFFHGIIVLQHPFVITMQPAITGVKQLLAQLRMIQEETTTEVIDCLTCLGQELVSDKGHMIPCLAEHFREHGHVTPVTLVTDGMKREHMLKYKTRQVPGCHHIGKGYQRTVLHPF